MAAASVEARARSARLYQWAAPAAPLWAESFLVVPPACLAPSSPRPTASPAQLHVTLAPASPIASLASPLILSPAASVLAQPPWASSLIQQAIVPHAAVYSTAAMNAR